MKKRRTSEVQTWGDVQRALVELGRFEDRLESKNERAGSKIQSVEERLGEESAVLLAEIGRLRQELERFFRRNSSCARTKTLPEGSLGLRVRSHLLIPRPGLTSRKLMERGLGDCLRLKESIDRQALARLDDDTLSSVGARRVVKEVFYARARRKGR